MIGTGGFEAACVMPFINLIDTEMTHEQDRRRG